jgi:hypothetical protein
MQALLGYHNESRWIRYARKSIIHLFPYLPAPPRDEAAGQQRRLSKAKPHEARPPQRCGHTS